MAVVTSWQAKIAKQKTGLTPDSLRAPREIWGYSTQGRDVLDLSRERISRKRMVVGLLVQSLPCDVILEYKQIVTVAEPGEGPETPPPPPHLCISKKNHELDFRRAHGPSFVPPREKLGGGGDKNWLICWTAHGKRAKTNHYFGFVSVDVKPGNWKSFYGLYFFIKSLIPKQKNE